MSLTMSLRAVVWLLVGLAAGFALGVGWRDEDAAPRAARPQDDVAPPNRRPAGRTTGTQGGAPRSSALKDASTDLANAIEPTEAVSPDSKVEPGMGRLTVDFQGFDMEPEFRVRLRGLDGEPYMTESEYVSDSLPWLDLQPGTYLAWWELPDRIGRWGMWVRIEAARTTHLRADDPRIFELPSAPGMGRVDLTVHAVGGGGFARAPILVVGSGPEGEDSLEATANDSGRKRLELVPGSYEIHVGDAAVTVEVVAGVTAPLDLLPVGLGDLAFDVPEGSPRFRLRWRGSEPAPEFRAASAILLIEFEGRKLPGYRMLAQGEYEVWASGRSDTIGRVEVQPGKLTIFRGAPGGIRARVHSSDPQAQPSDGLVFSVQRLESSGWAPIEELTRFEWPYILRAPVSGSIPPPNELSACAPFLPPGRYRAALRANGTARSEVVEIDVEHSMVEIELEFGR